MIRPASPRLYTVLCMCNWWKWFLNARYILDIGVSTSTYLSNRNFIWPTSVSRACFLSLAGPALVNRAPVLAPYVQQGLEQQARDLRSIKFETYRKTLQKAWRGTLGRNAASYSLMQIKYHSQLTALYIWMRPGAGFWNSGFLLLLLKKTGIWTSDLDRVWWDFSKLTQMKEWQLQIRYILPPSKCQTHVFWRR